MVRRSTWKSKYYVRGGSVRKRKVHIATMTKVGGKKLGRPVGSRTRKTAPRRTVRAPVRRKVAGRKPRCRVHRVCIRIGTRKVKAVMNCKGKVRLTKQGRKTFNVLKRRCKCRQNTKFGAKRAGKSCAVRRRTHRK